MGETRVQTLRAALRTAQTRPCRPSAGPLARPLTRRIRLWTPPVDREPPSSNNNATLPSALRATLRIAQTRRCRPSPRPTTRLIIACLSSPTIKTITKINTSDLPPSLLTSDPFTHPPNALRLTQQAERNTRTSQAERQTLASQAERNAHSLCRPKGILALRRPKGNLSHIAGQKEFSLTSQVKSGCPKFQARVLCLSLCP